jgi:hypothetical protein
LKNLAIDGSIIKIYLKVMGWTDRAQDREEWPALLKKAVNLQVPKKRRIFDELREQVLLKMDSALHGVNYCVIGSTL